MSINDNLIWNQAYIEEYYGIHTSSKTWEYITEIEYKALRPIVWTALPIYVISIIKKEEHGKAARVKNRIVVLGNFNFDLHDWSKSAYFAPVMFKMELNLMMALIYQLKIESKQENFIQAFCQSTSP